MRPWMACKSTGSDKATAGKGLGIQQFCLDTSKRKTRPFIKSTQMVEALLIDDGLQPNPGFRTGHEAVVLVGRVSC